MRVRGHLKVRKSRTNERTFIWEGGGLDPIRCAIDSKKKKKKKKKKARPSTDRAAVLAYIRKSPNYPIKRCKSLRDLEQVRAKKGWRCMHTAAINPGRRYRLAFEGQVN